MRAEEPGPVTAAAVRGAQPASSPGGETFANNSQAGGLLPGPPRVEGIQPFPLRLCIRGCRQASPKTTTEKVGGLRGGLATSFVRSGERKDLEQL